MFKSLQAAISCVQDADLELDIRTSSLERKAALVGTPESTPGEYTRANTRKEAAEFLVSVLAPVTRVLAQANRTLEVISELSEEIDMYEAELEESQANVQGEDEYFAGIRARLSAASNPQPTVAASARPNGVYSDPQTSAAASAHGYQEYYDTLPSGEGG